MALLTSGEVNQLPRTWLRARRAAAAADCPADARADRAREALEAAGRDGFLLGLPEALANKLAPTLGEYFNTSRVVKCSGLTQNLQVDPAV